MTKEMLLNGLNKRLEEGCSIKIFSCALRYPIICVERTVKGKIKTELVDYIEGGNILSLLIAVSNRINEEISKAIEFVQIPSINLDKVVERGYNLYCCGLPDGKVLSTICRTHFDKKDLLKGVITDSIIEGLTELSASFKGFDIHGKPQFYAHDDIERLEPSKILCFKGIQVPTK